MFVCVCGDLIFFFVLSNPLFYITEDDMNNGTPDDSQADEADETFKKVKKKKKNKRKYFFKVQWGCFAFCK